MNPVKKCEVWWSSVSNADSAYVDLIFLLKCTSQCFVNIDKCSWKTFILLEEAGHLIIVLLEELFYHVAKIGRKNTKSPTAYLVTLVPQTLKYPGLLKWLKYYQTVWANPKSNQSQLCQVRIYINRKLHYKYCHMIQMLQSCFSVASIGLISSTFTVSRYNPSVRCSAGIFCLEVTKPLRWEIRPEVSSMNWQAKFCASVLVFYFCFHVALERNEFVHVGDLILYNATWREENICQLLQLIIWQSPHMSISTYI